MQTNEFFHFLQQNAYVISLLSLFISCAGFAFSCHFGFRDSAKLLLKIAYHSPSPHNQEPYIHVRVVNKGRRPTIIRLLGGSTDTGGYIGTHLGDDRQGLRLAEHEIFEKSMSWEDLYNLGPDEECKLIDLWVEDTLGQRHKFKKSKKLLAQFWKDYGEKEVKNGRNL